MDILLVHPFKCADNILRMVKEHVGNKAAENCKPNSVAHSKGRGKVDWAVCLIHVFVNSSRGIQDFGRIVKVSGIVISIRTSQREIGCEPSVGVVEYRNHNRIYAKPSREDVCLGPERYHKGRLIVRNLTPVESCRQVSKAGGHAKEVIKDFVVCWLLAGVCLAAQRGRRDIRGAAQQIKAKVLNPVKMKPGSQYQQKPPTKTYKKNL